MRHQFVTGACLLLLSVATISVPLEGHQQSELMTSVVTVVVDVPAASWASLEAIDRASIVSGRDRILALFGVGSIGLAFLVLIGGLLILLLLAGIFLLFRRSDDDSANQSSSIGTATDPPSAREDGPGITRSAGPAESPERSVLPILTDEERVVQLLIRNHGRMKQSQIVAETDWSEAKVSRLLSRMEARDQIVRMRAGRQNVVQLTDANVQSFDRST